MTRLAVAAAALAALTHTTSAATAEPVPLTICRVFGPTHCYDALRVAWCESRWHTTARNGQHLGLYQVSAHWRQTIPGYGPTALEQTRHAFRVFKRTGQDWSHWTCRNAIR